MDAKTLNRLRFHLERLVQATSTDPEEDWEKLATLVRAALAGPAPADGRDLRRRLVEFEPRLAERRLPEDVFGLNRELERVAKAGAHKPPTPSAPRTPVEELAARLAGRTLLVIGGDPRREHQERLRAAFGLAEVLWPQTSETNPSVAVLEPYVARPEVALVLLLIKLNRHGVTEEIPGLCKRHGKPVVRLTGGYSPEQVAEQIHKQVGKRLAGP
ncbi:MAG: hypothetical protein JNK02_16235 [Planctomycetes bacterium]|nr:hypothetical protein [Planctomycetota bacterium]